MRERFFADNLAVQLNKNKTRCRVIFKKDGKQQAIEMPVAGVSFLAAKFFEIEREMQQGQNVAELSALVVTKYAAQPATDGSMNVGITLESGEFQQLWSIESEEARSLAAQITDAANTTPLRVI